MYYFCSDDAGTKQIRMEKKKNKKKIQVTSFRLAGEELRYRRQGRGGGGGRVVETNLLLK